MSTSFSFLPCFGTKGHKGDAAPLVLKLRGRFIVVEDVCDRIHKQHSSVVFVACIGSFPGRESVDLGNSLVRVKFRRDLFSAAAFDDEKTGIFAPFADKPVGYVGPDNVPAYPIVITADNSSDYSVLSELAIRLSSCVVLVVDEHNFDRFQCDLKSILGETRKSVLIVLFRRWRIVTDRGYPFEPNHLIREDIFFEKVDIRHGSSAIAVDFLKNLIRYFATSYVCVSEESNNYGIASNEILKVTKSIGCAQSPFRTHKLVEVMEKFTQRYNSNGIDIDDDDGRSEYLPTPSLPPKPDRSEAVKKEFLLRYRQLFDREVAASEKAFISIAQVKHLHSYVFQRCKSIVEEIHKDWLRSNPLKIDFERAIAAVYDEYIKRARKNEKDFAELFELYQNYFLDVWLYFKLSLNRGSRTEIAEIMEKCWPDSLRTLLPSVDKKLKDHFMDLEQLYIKDMRKIHEVVVQFRKEADALVGASGEVDRPMQQIWNKSITEMELDEGVEGMFPMDQQLRSQIHAIFLHEYKHYTKKTTTAKPHLPDFIQKIKKPPSPFREVPSKPKKFVLCSEEVQEFGCLDYDFKRFSRCRSKVQTSTEKVVRSKSTGSEIPKSLHLSKTRKSQIPPVEVPKSPVRILVDKRRTSNKTTEAQHKPPRHIVEDVNVEDADILALIETEQPELHRSIKRYLISVEQDLQNLNNLDKDIPPLQAPLLNVLKARINQSTPLMQNWFSKIIEQFHHDIYKIQHLLTRSRQDLRSAKSAEEAQQKSTNWLMQASKLKIYCKLRDQSLKTLAIELANVQSKQIIKSLKSQEENFTEIDLNTLKQDMINHCLLTYRSYLDYATRSYHYSNANLATLHDEIVSIILYELETIEFAGGFGKQLWDEVEEKLSKEYPGVVARNRSTVTSIVKRRGKVLAECIDVLKTHLRKYEDSTISGEETQPSPAPALQAALKKFSDLTGDLGPLVRQNWKRELEGLINSYMRGLYVRSPSSGSSLSNSVASKNGHSPIRSKAKTDLKKLIKEVRGRLVSKSPVGQDDAIQRYASKRLQEAQGLLSTHQGEAQMQSAVDGLVMIRDQL